MMKNFVIPTMDTPKADTLSEYLISSIEAFSNITGISVTYFNDRDEIVREFKTDDKICNIFPVYKTKDSACRKNLASAGQFASRLGEPYIFLCKAGLAHIAISLIIDEEIMGCFVAGPIVMGELRASTTKNFSHLNDLDEASSSVAKMFIGKMKTYQPTEISQIALLFYNCIITSVSGSNDYSTLRHQYDEQNKVNIDIQRYKKEHVSVEYPYDLENVLIDNVSNGQTALARKNVRQLLETFSILEAGDLDGIKAKTLWFFAIIIRMASESDSNLNQIIDTDLDIINRINEAESYNRLLKVSEDIIETVAKNTLSSIYSGRSQIVTKALQYINKNYKEKLSLKDIEANLHVNSSYFSTLFKQEMGITFTDYLNSLKIEHACQLLEHSNLSIIDVSLSTGFDDQSYFTKVFKKAKGLTPKAYRAEKGKNAEE